MSIIASLSHCLHRLERLSGLLGDCLLCGQSVDTESLLCRHCARELPPAVHACSLCGQPIPEGNPLCGACLRQPPPWHRLRVLGDYVSPYDHLIHQLKYQHQTLPAILLGRLMASRFTSPPLPEVLLPVPLHWWRTLRRGYNQAEELARSLGKELGIPVDGRLLCRRRATPSQTRLTRQARRRNLRGAFRIRPHGYRHVALVDDVVTTGSTAAELTRLLLRSGVQHVEVWAVCRTQTRHH